MTTREVKTDNTLQELGFEFQYLYALYYFWNNMDKLNWKIQVEKNADIAIIDEKNNYVNMIEVKHTTTNNAMTYASKNLWKTMANMYELEHKGSNSVKYSIITNEVNESEFPASTASRLTHVRTATKKTKNGEINRFLSHLNTSKKNIISGMKNP